MPGFLERDDSAAVVMMTSRNGVPVCIEAGNVETYDVAQRAVAVCSVRKGSTSAVELPLGAGG